MNKRIKLPLTVLLALGASLTLGFLSFVGLIAIIPAWQLGIAAFVLSTVYESQIYASNIDGAFDKLFGKDHLKLTLSKQLIDSLVHDEAARKQSQLLRDIKQQRRYVSAIESYGNLDKAGQKKREEAMANLAKLESFFMQVVFSEQHNDSALTQEILRLVPGAARQALIEKTQRRRNKYWAAFGFSALAGLSAGLATVFAVFSGLIEIPALGLTAATLAAATLPMTGIFIAAAAAFSAYWFMIYNTVTDIIHNETVTTWLQDMRADISKSNGIKSIVLSFALAVVVLLGAGLTIATAGTWLHMARGATKLTPILNGTSALFKNIIVPYCAMFFYGMASFLFNIENTKESFETIQHISLSRFTAPVVNTVKTLVGLLVYGIGGGLLRNATALARLQVHTAAFSRGCQLIWRTLFPKKAKENAAQRYNPFKFAVRLVSLPIRVAAFLGHIISIGVATDKVSGVPPQAVATVCTLSEGCEDLHYFAGSDHEHEHDHGHHHHGDDDLPSTLIKYALSPLTALSAAWDSLASQTNEKAKRVTWWQSFQRQFGLKTHSLPDHKSPQLSNEWQKQSRLMSLNDEIERVESSSVLMKSDVTEKKRHVLRGLYQSTLIAPSSQFANNGKGYQAILDKQLSSPWQNGKTESGMDVLGCHRNRFFAQSSKVTHSLDSIEQLCAGDINMSKDEAQWLPKTAHAA